MIFNGRVRVLIAITSVIVGGIVIMTHDGIHPVWAGLVFALIVGAAFLCGILYASSRGAAQLRDLRKRIGLFVETGERPDSEAPTATSSDLAGLYEAFDQLSQVSVADELRAKQSLKDRAMLIREVHHRVKNNLQLMSSILSMHIQGTADPDTVATLREIQQRVITLGTVHEDLYQNSMSGQLPIAGLLHEIADSAEKLAASRGYDIAIARQVMDTNLSPDHVVPLSLLVSEALNSVVRAAKPQSILLRCKVADHIRITIHADGDAMDLHRGEVVPQFMRVLAMQIDAELQERRETNTYAFALTFAAPEPLKPVAQSVPQQPRDQ